MSQQLRIKFPLFSTGVFDQVKTAHAATKETKLLNEIEHLKHQVAGYKGWNTKRNKKK